MNQTDRLILESQKLLLNARLKNSNPQERIEIDELIMRIDLELEK